MWWLVETGEQEIDYVQVDTDYNFEKIPLLGDLSVVVQLEGDVVLVEVAFDSKDNQFQVAQNVLDEFDVQKVDSSHETAVVELLMVVQKVDQIEVDEKKVLADLVAKDYFQMTVVDLLMAVHEVEQDEVYCQKDDFQLETNCLPQKIEEIVVEAELYKIGPVAMGHKKAVEFHLKIEAALLQMVGYWVPHCLPLKDAVFQDYLHQGVDHQDGFDLMVEYFEVDPLAADWLQW